MPDIREMEDRLLLKDALSREPACATPFALAALRKEVVPLLEGAALQKHVAGCTRCQVELRLLSEFEDAAPRPGEQEALSSIQARLEQRFSSDRPAAPVAIAGAARPWRRGPSFRRFQVGGYAVAAALLLAAVGIGLQEARPPELQSLPPTAMVLRSGELIVVSPAAELTEVPTELRWQPWTAAASYSVRVMEVDHNELWSAETRETAIALPAQVRERIVPRKPLLWEVVARDAKGGTLASSGTHRFLIKNQP